MWCSLGTSTPPCAYTRELIAGWHALAGVEVLAVDPVEELHRPADVLAGLTTSGRYSQSHSTIVRSAATGYIRWKITWSGTRLMNTCGLTVIA